jgi:hypothetical protein
MVGLWDCFFFKLFFILFLMMRGGGSPPNRVRTKAGKTGVNYLVNPHAAKNGPTVPRAFFSLSGQTKRTK